MYPYKRKSEGDVTQKKRRMWPQAKEGQLSLEAGKARKRFCRRASKQSATLLAPGFQPSYTGFQTSGI